MMLTMHAGHSIDLAVLACVHGTAAQQVCCYVQLTRLFMAMPHYDSQFTVEWHRRSNDLSDCCLCWLHGCEHMFANLN